MFNAFLLTPTATWAFFHSKPHLVPLVEVYLLSKQLWRLCSTTMHKTCSCRAPQQGLLFHSQCTAAAAAANFGVACRMFMDWIYPQLISKTRGVLHMQLVSTNMWWARDAPLHASMQVFLCKTLHCVGLMQQHVVQQHYWGSVWFMGHTSSDPTVGTSGDIIAQVTSSINPGSTEGFAIHVRGQSDRKQTKVVLDCWAHHPNFPPLVLVGKPADQELTNASRSAANIVYYPPLAPAESDSRGDDTIDGTRVRNLAAAAFMHICPSQSEGFGHYINEARAAGALIVTTRHPPMNEVVSDEQGVQVPTVLTDSDEGMGLADVGNLNGHVSAEGLCQAVQLALALPAAEQQKKRAAAAAAYRAEKAAFLSRMAQLRAYLHARRAAAAENFSSSSATAEAAAASLALASSSAGAEGAAARAAIGRKVGLVQ